MSTLGTVTDIAQFIEQHKTEILDFINKHCWVSENENGLQYKVTAIEWSACLMVDIEPAATSKNTVGQVSL